jgi:hypothetical protein
VASIDIVRHVDLTGIEELVAVADLTLCPVITRRIPIEEIRTRRTAWSGPAATTASREVSAGPGDVRCGTGR